MTYPLIKELGLDVYRVDSGYAVCPAELERILEQGVRVYGWNDERCDWMLHQDPLPGMKHTHTGLVINIKPIVKDTAESCLRDLIQHMEKFNSAFINSEYFDRAKRLLEQSK